MTWFWNKIRGFKTLGWNALGLLGAIALWGSSYDWSQINSKNAAAIGAVFSVINIVLRFRTSTPPMTGKD